MSQEYRSISAELRLLEKTGPYLFPVEVSLLNDKVNRNGWKFIGLEKNKDKFAGTPLLVAYVNGGRTIGSGHNSRSEVDPATGEPAPSFVDADAERIVGALSDDPNDIRLEVRGEDTWVVGKGFLWAFYAKELVSQIVDYSRQGRTMAVSIEALVTKSREEDGVEIEEEYEILGTTLLGNGVEPAVKDAHIAMLSASDEFKNLKLRAASYMKPETQETKPQNNPEKKGMKCSMRLSNQQARELQQKFGGYHVLFAEQHDDGKVDVALMDAKTHATYICRMSAVDEDTDFGKYPERIVRANAKVQFMSEDGEEMCMEADDLTDCAVDEAKAQADELGTCKAELETCKAELETMKANENARRLSAAKKTAQDTLNAFNANREEKVDAKVLEALTKDIDAGKYTSCEDEGHLWNGDKIIEKEVKALCADAVMAYDKRMAEKRMEPGEITWGTVRKASATPGTIGELFAAKNPKNK